MKRLIPILFFLCPTTVVAQKSAAEKETYYVYDENWKPCAVDAAKYLAVVNKLNDTTFEWKYYNYTGPLVYVRTYKDQAATILNGYLAYFDTKGSIDSSGYALNGNRDSTWYFYDDTLFIWLQKEYNNGELISTINNYEKQKEDEKAGIKPPVLESGEIEAEFPGGAKAWMKYLTKDFQAPDRGTQLGIKGTTMTLFYIDTIGKVRDLRTLKSVEFSYDKAVMQIIKKSPPWNPALQKGRKVKAFRKQPFTFG